MIKKDLRTSYFTELSKYCHMANKEGDFIEITHWTNGEGFDFSISSRGEARFFSLTHGEFKALQVLANYED